MVVAYAERDSTQSDGYWVVLQEDLMKLLLVGAAATTAMDRTERRRKRRGFPFAMWC